MKTIATVCAAAVLGALAAPAAHAETTIRVSLQLPMTNVLGKNLASWKECVEAQSDELKIQIFPSAQLYKDDQVPEAVGSGAIEMGTASLTRFAGSVPAVDAVYLPFLLDTPEKLRAATAPGSAFRAPIDAAILKETGVRLLWWQAFGRTVYLSKDPIRMPADLQGKKVRTFGKLLSWTVESLGGAPTIMSGSKQFLAYQQGAVDAGITGLTAVKSRKLYEVMDNLTLSFDAGIEFAATINENFYQSLADADRKVVDSCSVKVETELRDSILAEEDQVLADIKGKINIIELTQAERDAWREATKDVVARFIENGGETAAQVVAAAPK